MKIKFVFVILCLTFSLTSSTLASYCAPTAYPSDGLLQVTCKPSSTFNEWTTIVDLNTSCLGNNNGLLVHPGNLYVSSCTSCGLTQPVFPGPIYLACNCLNTSQAYVSTSINLQEILQYYIMSNGNPNVRCP
jgi:hypothetical protein